MIWMENVAIIQLGVLHGFVLSRQLGYVLYISQKTCCCCYREMSLHSKQKATSMASSTALWGCDADCKWQLWWL